MSFDPQYNLVTSISGALGPEVTLISGAVDGIGLFNLNAVRIQGRPVIADLPNEGEALIWNSITQQWEIEKVISTNNGGGINAPLTMGSGGNIFFNGNIISGTGNIYSGNFYGNGSNLTGIVHNAIKIQGRDVSSSAPDNGQVLTWNNSLSKWEPQSVSSTSGKGDIQVVFAAYDKNFYKFNNTSTWGEATVIVFRGTNVLGTPTSTKIVAKLDGSTSTPGQVRIFDITNNLQIAIWDSINTTQDKIYTTSLSNLPTGEAMFSIQGKKGSSYTFLRSLSIMF